MTVSTHTHKSSNPAGLHRKYNVSSADPDNPTDPEAQYFVLRLDAGGMDRRHILACQDAALMYADRIEPFLPVLARDLRMLVARERGIIVAKEIVESSLLRRTMEDVRESMIARERANCESE